MSLKAELETWAAALQAYDEEDFEKALDLFSRIADSSKILTNMGLIYATLGEHEAAVERFIEATGLDSYLAVAYFQCGVSNFLLARYELAYKDFEEALLYLRGNQAINYEQLGLKFRLFSAEVLFNQGLALIYMGRMEEGLADMEEAKRVKATDEHNVIDDAITDRGEGYTVFSIPVGVLYRPSEKKLVNAKTKDYMGKAKLIAASDSRDTTVGFSGIDRLQQGITPTGIFIDGETGLARSNTRAPAPRNDDEGTAPLARSKTTLNVVSKPSAGSRSAPTSSYAPSSFGGGSVRRRVTRRNTRRIQSAYEEEEEGYASGEDFDGPFELIKIRVKLHYDDDVRGMALTPETPFEEFMDKVTAKFGKDINGLTLKFKDEDGGKVSLRDESDYELAIETARESSKGKPEGKLEIWCTDA